MREIEQKPLVKVAIIGPHQSGITSYIKAIKNKNHCYNGKYEPSFSINFQMLEFENLDMQLFDLPEDKAYRPLVTESYLKISQRLVLLLDVSKQLDDMQKWLTLNKAKISRCYSVDQPILVLLNKIDVTDVIPMQKIEALLVSTFPLFNITVMYCSVYNGFGIKASKERLVSSAQAVSKGMARTKKSKTKYSLTRVECIALFIKRLKTHQQKLQDELQEREAFWLYRWFSRDNKDIKLLCIRTLLNQLESQASPSDKFHSLIDLDKTIDTVAQEVGVDRWRLANAGFFSNRFAHNIKKSRQEWHQRVSVDVVAPVFELPTAPF